LKEKYASIEEAYFNQEALKAWNTAKDNIKKEVDQ